MKRLVILILLLALSVTACTGPVSLSSPSLSGDQTYVTVNSGNLNRAADYAALIKMVIKAQENQNNKYGRLFGITGATAAAENSSQDSASGKSASYSQTNIQVEGVDEADIIKTDGRYLYLVANNRLYIVDAQDPAQMKILSTQKFIASEETDKISTGEYPVEMYLDAENQRLVLIVCGWLYEKTPVEAKPGEQTETAATGSEAKPPDETATATAGSDPESKSTVSEAKDGIAVDMLYPYFNNKQYTTTKIYDLTDKSSPQLVRQFTQTGYYLTSRKIDNVVYVVTNEYKYQVFAENTEPKPEEIFPATSSAVGTITEDNWETLPADKISILPDGDVNNQMVLSAIDTLDDGSEPDLQAVLGTSGTVYASAGFLYVAAFQYQWDGKETSYPVTSTDIFRFKLADAQISEAGKGSVPGTIINQFSMDEHQGYFRIATTTGEVWTSTGESAAKNNVYVLDSGLKVVGKVTGLAPGESIKSVRFAGDQAYVVTFRNVDPLFVVDLSEPAAPKVLGQLKIPGYSTYLHPYADNILLGFGYDVKNEGDNAYNMGLKVSLFDVSDFANPKELSTILLGGRGSYADILYNHKSLLFSKEKNLIAFPATLTKTITDNPLEYGQPVFQGLLVLSVDNASKIILRGQITHFDKLNDPDGQPATLTEEEMQAFYGYDAISRGAWIGDILYTFSARQIRAANMSDLSKIGAVELPGYQDNPTYYYYGGVVAGRAESGVMID